MGWFWADTTPAGTTSLPPHAPLRSSDAKPPPSCPMHNKTLPSTAPSNTSLLSSPSPPEASACPVLNHAIPQAVSSASSAAPAKEPSPLLQKLNPLNYMPSNISNSRAEQQKITLGLDREASTIPKGNGHFDGFWEYPSPQQMYNAMLRKGYTDTPEDAVESMVAVHNFLNEGAWAEIMEWERRFSGGLAEGWRSCKRGEDGTQFTAAEGGEWNEPSNKHPPRLIRFMGRPGDLTPKARILQTLGYIAPERFGGEGPFDRHDWFVQRTFLDGSSKEVRYVIDYYSGPPEPTGEPVFFLDVRPAVDSPIAACERLLRWGGDMWWRGTGGAIREKKATEAQEPSTWEGMIARLRS